MGVLRDSPQLAGVRVWLRFPSCETVSWFGRPAYIGMMRGWVLVTAECRAREIVPSPSASLRAGSAGLGSISAGLPWTYVRASWMSSLKRLGALQRVRSDE